MDRRQLNVKIPIDLYQELDNRPENKTDIVISALNSYLFDTVDSSQNKSPDSDLVNEYLSKIDLLSSQLIAKDSQIADLHKQILDREETAKMQLSQVQTLIKEIQQYKMLESPNNKKKWYEFWK